MQATTRLTSRLLGGHWRLTVGQQYTWAEVPEGTVSLNRASFGVTYEGPDFRGLAEVVDLAGTQNRVGGRVTGDWTPDDQWGVHLSGQLAAAETPLRAIKTGVIGNSGEGGVRYRFHESREIGLDWRVTSFSDDNLRQEGFFHLSQRLVDVPRFALTAILELYGSTNSRTDVAYFSPGWIVTPDVAVEAEHLAWRRYRTSLTQALVLTVGATFQQGFDGAPIVVGRYEHRWHWNPRFELTYGVEAGSRVFDGGRQQDYSTYVQFRGKF